VNVPLVSWHFTLAQHRVTPRGWPRPAGERLRFFLSRMFFWWGTSIFLLILLLRFPSKADRGT
jgi:hypothetical protein